MSAEHQGRKAAADYLDHFGLSADPFESGLSPLFEGGQRRELLAELLRHCQLNTKVLAVVGEAGVGKSCFRHALMERLKSETRIGLVDVPLLSGAEQLLMQVAEQLGVPSAASRQPSDAARDAGSWVARIRDFAEQSAEGDSLTVLVVENAHNLDNESLGCLLELSADDVDARGAVHLVLFGEPELIARLAVLEERGLEEQGHSVKTVVIEPFSATDLKSYLRFRLEAADFDGIFPFSPADMQYVWEASGGIPAAAHGPARDILIDLAQPPPEPESLGLPIGHMVAITALVAGLLIAVFYRSGEPRELPVSTVQVDSGVQSSVVSGPDPVAGQLTKEATSGAIATSGYLESSGAENAKNKRGDAPEPSRTIEASTENGAGDRVEAVPRSGSSPPVSDEASPEPASSLGSDESTLLARSPERFTLQISAAASRKSVDDFVQAQRNRDNLLVFAALRDGKTLHIVVTGDFASAQEARSAISALPDIQQQAGPWPRPLSSVQGDIRQHRDL